MDTPKRIARSVARVRAFLERWEETARMESPEHVPLMGGEMLKGSMPKSLAQELSALAEQTKGVVTHYLTIPSGEVAELHFHRHRSYPRTIRLSIVDFERMEEDAHRVEGWRVEVRDQATIIRRQNIAMSVLITLIVLMPFVWMHLT